jgi:hypothetical protein
MATLEAAAPVAPEDFLHVGTWGELAKESGFTTWDGYDVDLLFKEPPPERPTVLVTSCYDAAPCYQSEHHPAEDLVKYVPVVDWEGLSRVRDRYPFVGISSYRQGRCHPKDRYSVKTDRYTWGTFPEIPAWVIRWFTTNANIDDERVELLPFGLNDDGPGSSYLPEYMGRDKTDLLYVNFQLNSQRRLRLHQVFSGCPFATYRPSPNLPVRTYFDELSRHKFCLCPAGNGLDQYRILECVYLGVVPIVEESRWSLHLLKTGLPVLMVDDMEKLREGDLGRLWEEVKSRPWDYRQATRSWWRKRFQTISVT